MAQFPSLPLWTDSYLADTRHLTAAEHGAYLLLLMEAWRRPACSLPDDDALLARIACLSPTEWASSRSVIMAFWKRDGRSKTWTQKRLKKERDYVATKSKSQSDKAAKRWEKAKKADAAALPQQSRGNAPTPIVTVPNGTGASAPIADVKKAAFDRGVALLSRDGMDIKSARAMVGKWVASRGAEWTLRAIEGADGVDRPLTWIQARAKAAGDVAAEAESISRATARRYRELDMPPPPPGVLASERHEESA